MASRSEPVAPIIVRSYVASKLGFLSRGGYASLTETASALIALLLSGMSERASGQW